MGRPFSDIHTFMVNSFTQEGRTFSVAEGFLYLRIIRDILCSDVTDVTFPTSADADADVRLLTSADADADADLHNPK